MNSIELPIEEADRWLLPLVGWAVERCVIGEAFVVELKLGRRRGRVTVQGTFIVKAGGGKSILQKSPPSSMGPALALLGKEIERATALKDGRLELAFSGQTALSVRPERQAEAWTVAVGHDLMVVCEPGGRVAIWVPDEDEE